MTSAGNRLLAAASEALAIAKGERSAARTFVPAEINVRALRRSLALSQERFAAEFGFSVHQIRDWEQGRSRPQGPLRAYLVLIGSAPASVRELMAQARGGLAV